MAGNIALVAVVILCIIGSSFISYRMGKSKSCAKNAKQMENMFDKVYIIRKDQAEGIFRDIFREIGNDKSH